MVTGIFCGDSALIKRCYKALRNQITLELLNGIEDKIKKKALLGEARAEDMMEQSVTRSLALKSTD